MTLESVPGLIIVDQDGCATFMVVLKLFKQACF